MVKIDAEKSKINKEHIKIRIQKYHKLNWVVLNTLSQLILQVYNWIPYSNIYEPYKETCEATGHIRWLIDDFQDHHIIFWWSYSDSHNGIKG